MHHLTLGEQYQLSDIPLMQKLGRTAKGSVHTFHIEVGPGVLASIRLVGGFSITVYLVAINLIGLAFLSSSHCFRCRFTNLLSIVAL